MLRELNFEPLESIPEFNEKKFLNLVCVNQFISDHMKNIDILEVGIAEDAFATFDIFWCKDEGYNKEYCGIFDSAWGTPTARVTFLDGTELSFACIERKVTKLSMKQRLVNIIKSWDFRR